MPSSVSRGVATVTRRPSARRCFALWLLLLAILQTKSAASGESSSSSDSSAYDWVHKCRAAGFDPEQLACSTCQILPASVQAECRRCCAAWLDDAQRRTQPYQAAVLIDRTTGASSQGEVAQFLEQDWKEVVSAKGANRLKHVIDESGSGSTFSSFSSLFAASRPSVVLFFDSTAAVSGRSDVSQLVAAAKESVSLHGLERADLKDMLMTLLPQ